VEELGWQEVACHFYALIKPFHFVHFYPPHAFKYFIHLAGDALLDEVVGLEELPSVSSKVSISVKFTRLSNSHSVSLNFILWIWKGRELKKSSRRFGRRTLLSDCDDITVVHEDYLCADEVKDAIEDVFGAYVDTEDDCDGADVCLVIGDGDNCEAIIESAFVELYHVCGGNLQGGWRRRRSDGHRRK